MVSISRRTKGERRKTPTGGKRKRGKAPAGGKRKRGKTPAGGKRKRGKTSAGRKRKRRETPTGGRKTGCRARCRMEIVMGKGKRLLASSSDANLVGPP